MTLVVGKSHQRLIREQSSGLFDPTVRLSDAAFRKIDSKTAASIILRYEWLGAMPKVVHSCFGLYFNDVLGGALVFAEKPGANLATRSGGLVPPDALYLARGACVGWSPPNAASWFISAVCRSLGNVSVLAYADPAAGEIGQIYRALNWHYLGQSPGGPAAWTVDGKLWGTRAIQRRFGTRSADVLRAAFGGAEIVAVPRKHRFLGVYGDRRYRRSIERTLTGLPAYRLAREIKP